MDKHKKLIEKQITKANENIIYKMGFIGALVFYISHAQTFWIGIFGIVRAAVWPAMLVYETFNFFLLK